jgi:hypothetical protein
MTTTQQQKAAKEFAARWQGKGYEKGESQIFWVELLEQVFGIQKPSEFLSFEQQVKLDHTAFIDAFIPRTHVMIEQKSIEKDLGEPIKQSDGKFLTPFQQAKRYSAELPYSLRPRWIVTCNFREFWVYDMEQPKGEPQKILLENLEKEYYRLQFLVDEGNEHLKRELEVSVKAGEIVGLIYDALLEQYIDKTDAETLRSLNILCVRLVFCLYAEDAGLFATKTAFHDYLVKFGSVDFRHALIELFKLLDTPIEERDPYLDDEIAAFPYVNGGLFSEEHITIPRFTDKIKQLLLQNASSDFDWSEISPTIFGAVFESTLNPETRRSGGMHYTSIENIHKVIDPLFMDDLNNEFVKIAETKQVSVKRQALANFQDKLASLTFLDPACGSGNFLTETYLSLRRLENKIIKELNNGTSALNLEGIIKVNIAQFYGIEINDFACTVAKTALWIAESQMLHETSAIVDVELNFLPLKTNANIVEGNALKLDWATLGEEDPLGFLFTDKLNYYIEKDFGEGFIASEPKPEYGNYYKELNVVAKKAEEKQLPKNEPKHVVYDYIMGNPPFVGYTFQSEKQKEDLSLLSTQMGKNIDYVVGWYIKASRLIQFKQTKCAFVSTNSITQGEQVVEVWRSLFELYGIQIDFAYRTFKWDSESEQKAHVHCVIIGFSHKDSLKKEKIIFDENGEKQIAQIINPYLMDAPVVWIEKRKMPICNVSKINKGSQPTDGGNLIISAEEYDDFIKKEPNAKKFIKEFLGADEFINGRKRFCLWLVDASPAELRKMPLVMKRVEAVKEMRSSSNKAATRNWAAYPYLFTENRQPERGNYLLIPRVSSEKRYYIPIGYVSHTIIASDAVQIIPNATLFEFGVLTSLAHNAWMRVVCGRLKSDYRYSNDIVYNNFPWPKPTEKQKAKIEQTAQAILDARAKYPESSLADLYDERAMPADLRKAHQANDKAVMAAYGFSLNNMFDDEKAIVAELFKLYQSYTENNN